jgi:hypothetical protein
MTNCSQLFAFNFDLRRYNEGEEEDGATAAAGARLASLRIVFLHRLVSECQSFFNGLSAGSHNRFLVSLS